MIVFSVFQKNSDRNMEHTSNVHSQLVALGIPVRIIKGVYTHEDGTAVEELSFTVERTKPVLALVKSLARKYNQESILEIVNGYGYLTFLDSGESKPIGRWAQCEDTKGLTAYSVIDGKVWTCQ